MTRRLLAAVVTLALAAVLLVACWPQLFGLERAPGVIHVVAMRGMVVLVAVLLAMLFTLIALLAARLRRFLAGLALLLLVFAVVSTGVLAVRGFGGDGFQTKAPADVVVLSWNTLGDAPGAEAIAELAIAQEADIVVLPETSHAAGEQVRQLLANAGRPMQLIDRQLDTISKARSTELLISEHLGVYVRDEAADSTPTLPSLVAVPVNGSGPTIVAAHPVSPMPGELRAWRDGLDWLAARCQDTANVIMAGDLNSTLDHWASYGSSTGLADCRDAARAAGGAAVGTWPAVLPPLLGAPIDHVLATEEWEIIGFRVIESADGAGSDHRPVVAQLRPAP
ncbi:endonuclease/exonuclease/phosphatase family protein [Protaetiibacter larvae]|uniref:Endonuclease/exonuclease/phosphatase family protein n=1 Tax=Protaetiibacter larvae TaxID=2592654 RepID=A0A5C1Y762_9MICO|nr:endonuclease/exonuclease/phosphatase family protein [Protaetiibacter larvae]QEO09636.1 endonuclease/exonuclease/phosphatase family protein [Protaetiibacter larvae]